MPPGRPAAFSLDCRSCAADLSGVGPTRTRYSLLLPLVTADTDALKPLVRTSSARRSAFSLLRKTPSCTPQPPDSLAAGASECGLAVALSAAAVWAGFGGSARAATLGEGWFDLDASDRAATFGVDLGASARAAVSWLAFGGAAAEVDCLAGFCDEAAAEVCVVGVRDGGCSRAEGCGLGVAADEGAGLAGTELGLAACASVVAEESHVDDSVRSFSGVGVCVVGWVGWGCGGPELPAAPLAVSDCECESSPRLMVYDRNGGSSDEGEAAPAGGGVAAGPFGPDNSSGTNSTIKTTRMIAPVSRSFTRSSKVGTKSPQSRRQHSVYAKPGQ